MKKLIILVAVVAILSVGAFAAAGSLDPKAGKLGEHDVWNGTIYMGCKSCHLAHNGQTFYIWGAPISASVTIPDAETGTNVVYTKPTSDSDPLWHTYACMGCHDGTTATNILSATNPSANGTDATMAYAAIASDADGLKNDHPVHALPTHVTVPKTAGAFDGTLRNIRFYADPADATYGYRVECSSCHDPHNADPTQNYKMLRVGRGSARVDSFGTAQNVTRWDVDSAGLAFCRECHNR